ncbi:G-type lectin S-receptor-like serine/threonine-protein kinase At1g11300 [Neltuma alba]|uniref:G-type lectin S-receptor-like serine/threonine-protein kinase At1g11300 n=1 Tax=Neltuma alba TaxID=207710 RepID=UPI0010A46B8B|nr:G-type lectin S-receptor-like serine/threonine-protein kinase At1g11300 [Prosopis alba]
MFTLGFFSTKNSTNRYVGIWLMSESNVVWVANRNNPLRDSSGILTTSWSNGNLLVLNGQEQGIWSTNVSNIASNSSAQLLDSGNLVLVDGATGATLWQSFQHPCDTFLQGMKLSTNQQKGKKVTLTSWESTSDPSSDFLGTPGKSSTFGNELEVKEEEGSVEVSFHYTDKSLLMIFTTDSQGRLEQRLWSFQRNIWEVGWTIVDSECDVYRKCGPSGIYDKQSSPICSCLRGFEPKNKEELGRQNWTSGCVRREALQCERDNNGSQGSLVDGFLKLESVKVPAHAEMLPDYNFSNAIDCQTPCSKNCSCKAYAYETGLGCMFGT